MLRLSLRDEKRVFLRSRPLSFSKNEISDWLGECVSLLEDLVMSIVENKRVERATNLLEKESGDEPCDDGEGRGDCTRKEVRVFFKELAVTKQFGEPFRRT